MKLFDVTNAQKQKKLIEIPAFEFIGGPRTAPSHDVLKNVQKHSKMVEALEGKIDY